MKKSLYCQAVGEVCPAAEKVALLALARRCYEGCRSAMCGRLLGWGSGAGVLNPSFTRLFSLKKFDSRASLRR